ncbi:Helicase IV [Actinomyces bovis]|uniref:Helicase IV n=1 Tax=Actinomyces bovis TaxID=1658 RepID=A0ABY1VQ33_9ACTO|nr:UvrD-helicase domain-containing protein [Actinomyces bovis]SPT53918.1 Helicase IV [Actinomyces bovis]VEG53399.1 Helicase IV [Actinomyces israelii]
MTDSAFRPGNKTPASPANSAAEASAAPTGSTNVRERELAAEQDLVDLAYSELDRQLSQARESLARTESAGAHGTHQARGERDAYAAHYSNQVSTLEGVEDRLVFGRMDMLPAEGVSASGSVPVGGPGRHYVGRLGLQDERRREVVLDWRAPLARAFYQATASRPMGLLRRRHIDTRARKVISLEDELISVDAVSGQAGGLPAKVATEGLQGEGALIAAMSTARDGRMGDIVATIQAEQDRVVTSPGKGVLVVQGGPGTGKTAVALHRVAYLFYAERERLERTGVLLVGPSRVFLRYVEQVLPSLGETGVVATTIGDLVPGLHAQGTEAAEIAEVKGRALWVPVLRRAVRSLQRVPAEPRPIEVQGTTLQLLPQDVREAISRARRSGRPHNLARETFVLYLLDCLTDQYAAATRQDASDPDTKAWIREDIRTARDARREINLCWMPTTPVGLLERLWSRPALLEELAPELSVDERALLQRQPGSLLTAADIPLVDELAELLGPSEDAEARRARLEAKRRAADVAYAAQAIESQDLGGGLVTAEMLADRFADTGPSLTLAERARADRSWTYGHVVVDEAQELGAMAWRALARRCPVRSFTVVGDLAQYSGPHAPATWNEILTALGAAPAEEGAGRAASGSGQKWRSRPELGRGRRQVGGSTPLLQEVLTVCYRTPASIMRAAEDVAAGMGHPAVYPVKSVRDLPNCLQVDDLTQLAGDDSAWQAALRAAVTAELEWLDEQAGVGAGRLAVISTKPQETVGVLAAIPALHEAMQAPDDDVLRSRLAVMDPLASKGLEFDAVVLLDPAAVGAVSPGDLYVAMTRPTRRLRVLSRQALPPGLREAGR